MEHLVYKNESENLNHSKIGVFISLHDIAPDFKN